LATAKKRQEEAEVVNDDLFDDEEIYTDDSVDVKQK
jgi:hypothetical protein